MRAVLFDFNGVLVDDEPLHFSSLRRALAEEDIELNEVEYYQRWLGIDDRAAISGILESADSEPPTDLASRLVARKAAYYRQAAHADGLPETSGARALVEALANDGWMLGVVSGALRDEVETGLAQIGIRNLFKTVITADDVSRGKPSPEGYLRGMQELNTLPPLPSRLLHPHEVLAIEDSPAGLRAAIAAGLPTLALAHTYAADRLREADHMVDDLSRLTPAGLLHLFSDDTSTSGR